MKPAIPSLLATLALALPAAAQDAGAGKGTPAPAAPGKAEAARPAPAAKEAPPAKPPAAAAPARSPRTKREALRILEAIVLSVKFEATPLRDVVSYMAAVTGVNIVLGPALLKEGDVDVLKVDLVLRKVSARQVLELVVGSRDLGIGFQSGVLTVTTRKEARGKPVLRLHPIGDLTFPIRDFPGPEMELRPAGAERTVPEETETKPAFSDPDDILALVKENTGKGTWEDEDVSASTMRDWLVIRQYEDVQEEIGRLVALLRAAR
jgi:hypothetical protein